ncbi:hypothetical protein D9M70_498150 [compost metagenome]
MVDSVQPVFKNFLGFFQSEYGLPLRVIVAAFLKVGEGCAFHVMDQACNQRLKPSFNMCFLIGVVGFAVGDLAAKAL